MTFTRATHAISPATAANALLALATISALAWANAPGGGAYEEFWAVSAFARDLRFWVNDGAMTVFFFAVGLEIRHEIHAGALSDWRRALLPLAAAAGGMLFPALIYAALNAGGAAARGWGVPMATDIAFAAAALAAAGPGVPPALRALLLALAVIDDIGAIAVIAAYYSAGIGALGVAVAAAGTGAVVLAQRLGWRSPFVYVTLAAVVWRGALIAGVHPTLAGVVLGLLTPAASGRRVLPRLQPWVAFGILPAFALANAGVRLDGAAWTADSARLVAGVAAGLIVGKPLGVVAATALALATKAAALPPDTTWRGIGVVGMTAGIGFTMAVFVAQLAFPPGPLLATAKLAVLAASATAALLAVAGGRFAFCRPAAAKP